MPIERLAATERPVVAKSPCLQTETEMKKLDKFVTEQRCMARIAFMQRSRKGNCRPSGEFNM